MAILTHSSNSQNFIKSNNKIPEYARDYKREYLFIIGLDKKIKYLVEHINDASTSLFENHRVDRIKYFIKRFLKGQERGKLKDISCFKFKGIDVENIVFIYDIMVFEIKEGHIDCDYVLYSEFYVLLCKFYYYIKYDTDEIDYL